MRQMKKSAIQYNQCVYNRSIMFLYTALGPRLLMHTCPMMSTILCAPDRPMTDSNIAYSIFCIAAIPEPSDELSLVILQIYR